MGREIRRVPPNWEHPRSKCEHSPWKGGCDDAKRHGGMCFQPLHDEPFEAAAREWKNDLAAWESGERAAYLAEHGDDLEYWEYNGEPPDRAYYRPAWSQDEASWYQAYETVSEGTPVTPPFETPEELIDYLATHGDFWDQGRGDPPPSRASCESFVRGGYAPSMTFDSATREIKLGINALDEDR